MSRSQLDQIWTKIYCCNHFVTIGQHAITMNSLCFEVKRLKGQGVKVETKSDMVKKDGRCMRQWLSVKFFLVRHLLRQILLN